MKPELEAVTPDSATTTTNNQTGTGRVGEWQPIETAPQDRAYMLLYLSGDGYHGPRQCDVVVGLFTDSGWYHISDGGGGKVSNEPTHWMPLPEPPTTGDTNG
jgi:hypothetical protein